MVADTRPDLLQGTLDMLILKVVAAGPLHGYAIAQRINQISQALLQVPQGSLYPALHRIENRGWLAASWAVTESGRQAKVYKLTVRGRRRLDEEVAGWERMSAAIQLILQHTE
jgi:transcriptional regulator